MTSYQPKLRGRALSTGQQTITDFLSPPSCSQLLQPLQSDNDILESTTQSMTPQTTSSTEPGKQ
jgi:hypothetical protein